MQLAAIPLLDPAYVAQEKVPYSPLSLRPTDLNGPSLIQLALQKHFKMKRDHVLKRLKELHLEVDVPPTSTFYIWLNLESLPPPLNNGLVSPERPFSTLAECGCFGYTDILRRVVEREDHRRARHIL
jgi:hypothetical protein